MSNGNMLTELREMAEKQNLSTKVALPLIFAGLVDIIERQEEARKERQAIKEKLDNNPMIRLGELISKHPKTMAVITVMALLAIYAAGPLILERLLQIP